MHKLKLFFLVLTILLSIVSCDSNSDTKKANKTKLTTSPAVMQKEGYSNIKNDRLEKLLEDDVVLIDIRRKDEWKRTGIIRGSNAITFFDSRGNINPNFVPELSALANTDKPIILICQTGGRTKAASAALVQQLGYKHVMNVTHGISGWIRENREVIKYN